MTIDTTKPAELEHRLVTSLRDVALRILEKPEIARALSAADSLKPGLVIHDEAHATELADVMRQVIDGEKLLAAEVEIVLRIPKQVEKAVRAAVAGVRDSLAAAKKVGNDARVVYQDQMERRAAEVERQKRIEAEAARQAAATQAHELGDPDSPPAPEIAKIEAPRLVRGGAGSTGTQTRVTAVEIVDDASCPVGWKSLMPAVAKGFFDTAVRAGEIPAMKPNEERVWNGVLFRAVRTAVNR